MVTRDGPRIELSNVKGITMLFCFNVKQCYSCANYLMEITVNKLFTAVTSSWDSSPRLVIGDVHVKSVAGPGTVGPVTRGRDI